MNLGDFHALSFDCYRTLIDWETGIAAVLRPWADGHGLDKDVVVSASSTTTTPQVVKYRPVTRRAPTATTPRTARCCR